MAENEAPFRVKDLVEAADDRLAGVPEGTPGVITAVSGLTWIRYRVRFGNGREVNLVDGSHLRPRSRSGTGAGG